MLPNDIAHQLDRNITMIIGDGDGDDGDDVVGGDDDGEDGDNEKGRFL